MRVKRQSKRDIVPMPDGRSFGALVSPGELLHWRISRNLSQTRLAEMLGCTHASISHWENGVYTAPHWLRLALESVDRRLPPTYHQGAPAT